MKTALEIAMERAESLQLIPLITNPMGRSWSQPDRSEILLDETSAVMTRRTFNRLAEYSASQPSGVYEGKMWKRHDGGFDHEYRARGGKPVWKLVWFGKSLIGPGYCSRNYRVILIIEDGSPVCGCSCCGIPTIEPAKPDEADTKVSKECK